MYQEFFGLRELPFELTATPQFLFLTAKQREVLSILQYGLLSAKSITLLVGANVAPSFTPGANETVLEDSGLHTIPNWATNIIAGPPNESAQTLSFIASNDLNSLFSAQPTVSSSGTLTYTLADASERPASATGVMLAAQLVGGSRPWMEMGCRRESWMSTRASERCCGATASRHA